MTELLESVQRLDKDLVDAIRTGKLTMTREDIRYMVDLYYQLQDFRKASANQDRASSDIKEPTRLVSYVFKGMRTLENQVKRAMDAWTEDSVVGRWAKSQIGIGPVLSAGLASHIDIERAPTVGHIWRFAGLDPTCIWLGRVKAEALVKELAKKKSGEIKEPELTAMLETISKQVGTKPDAIRKKALQENGKVTVSSLIKAVSRKPWNARLKTLCWKIGDSFVKVHNKEDAFYGHFYAKCKAEEVEKNARKEFSEQAEQKLRDFKIKDTATKKVYEDGRLPDGRIDLRARRQAVKLFLAHWHREAYVVRYEKEPPLPYPIAHLGHTHVITAPVERPASDE